MKGLQIMKTRMISPATHIHVLGNPSDNLIHGRRGRGGWILNAMARVDQLAF